MQPAPRLNAAFATFSISRNDLSNAVPEGLTVQMPDKDKAEQKQDWTKPELVQLTVDLRSVAGNRFPPGDNGVTNGKSTVPTS